MFGLMQEKPLMISSIITHAACCHPRSEIISVLDDGTIHRSTYKESERRARRLAQALQNLGVQTQERIATLAWNNFRHFELYYAITGMQAICHTINPRLSIDEIAFIVNDASDTIIFTETSFLPLIEKLLPRVGTHLRAIVVLTDPSRMPATSLPPEIDLLCYEELIAVNDVDYLWPEFDERTAAILCYSSGTTGFPKGVLYSHRSTVLLAYAINGTDVYGLRATDRALPVVPMFHVNAWGIPFAAPMVGASLILPGPHCHGASLTRLMNDERVTFAAAVPTIWFSVLNHLRTSDSKLETVQRLVVGGSACPGIMVQTFESEYGIHVHHAWGMTETSPLGTFNQIISNSKQLSSKDYMLEREKQGRVVYGLETKIVNDAGFKLPWDGQSSGTLLVRGHWVCSAYYGNDTGSACDENGWFATGDVGTIDPDGYLEIVDRHKDIVKSGGEWISSIRLENIAVEHNDVAEAAIVAVSHAKWGERPLLIVVPHDGCQIDKIDLLNWYEGKVPSWWIPDNVVIVDALPHSAAGKIQKNILREKYREILMIST